MKHLLIMRGLPGSGKSTAVKRFVKHCSHKSVICSADSFRMIDGAYVFKSNDGAHEKCFRQAVKSMGEEVPFIIIDNTNIRRSEWDRYAIVGYEMGYSVEFNATAADTPEKVLEFAKRNTHRVPISMCFQMWEKWENHEW